MEGGRRQEARHDVRLPCGVAHVSLLPHTSMMFAGTDSSHHQHHGNLDISSWCVPQVDDAVVNIGHGIAPSGRGRVTRRRVDGGVAGAACPRPALELLPRVLHSSQTARVVSAPFCRNCTCTCTGQNIAFPFGRGARRREDILLHCR